MVTITHASLVPTFKQQSLLFSRFYYFTAQIMWVQSYTSIGCVLKFGINCLHSIVSNTPSYLQFGVVLSDGRNLYKSGCVSFDMFTAVVVLFTLCIIYCNSAYSDL
jgi:hypothetical protein